MHLDALGGHLWRCDQCSHEVFSYHSCKNRSCPKCHTKQTKDWLEARKAEMLPTDYFHVTITVPQELRALLRANQRDGYALLMKAAADAIIELAHDRRFVGGTVGVLAVLHTWTQQLVYHPHVHCLVTGGGISDDGRDWHPARKAFLVPHIALAKLLRGKLKAVLANKRPDLITPAATWAKPWVVNINHWGQGHEAVLRYLADTYSASPSPTRASSPSTTTPSPSATSSANHRAGAPAACTATSSFAASSSMFCPKAFTRSDILAFGTLPNATAPLRPAFSSTSSAKPRRSSNPRRRAFPKSLTKAPQPPASRGLSTLRSRPSRLHPQAHPQECPWTMTHFFRFQDRLSFLPASFRRHSLPRTADQIIFLPVFSKPSTDLHCPPASRQNPSPPINPRLSRQKLDRTGSAHN